MRRPLLTVSKDLYRPGDVLQANCTSLSPASADPDLHADTAVAPTPHGRRHPHGGPLVPLLQQAPPLQPHQLSAAQRAHLQKDPSGQPPMSFSFWVNNRPVGRAYARRATWRSTRLWKCWCGPTGWCIIGDPFQVPAAMVRHGASSATLTRPIAEDDFSAAGELRIKCSVTLADKYREPSHAVTVRRQEEDDDDEYWEEAEDDDEGPGVEEPPVAVTETHAAVNAALPDPANRSSGAGECDGHDQPAEQAPANLTESHLLSSRYIMYLSVSGAEGLAGGGKLLLVLWALLARHQLHR